MLGIVSIVLALLCLMPVIVMFSFELATVIQDSIARRNHRRKLLNSHPQPLKKLEHHSRA